MTTVSVGRNRLTVVGRALRTWQTRAGLVVTLALVLFALAGPLFAAYSPSAIVDAPYLPPSPATPLGTDYLGHDVLSRLLNGGRLVLVMSLSAAALGVAAGVLVGLIAGYAGKAVSAVSMGVLLAFPNFVLPILFVSMIGPSPWLIVVLVAATHLPRVARLVRATTSQVMAMEYIEACEIMGLPRRRILFSEVLPNIATPIMVEFGIRVTWSITMIAGISFLGFGVQPPIADWGLMINENKGGFAFQPFAILPAILCIALLAIGTNLVTEGFSRAVAGTSSRRLSR
jgi:peptide/nickel transport system permease protein